MKKLIFLSVICAMSSLMYADGFTTSNNKYYCELGKKRSFKDSSDNGKEYYMALFFCRSKDPNDNYYKFISYNLYLNNSLTHSVDIGLPVSNITSMSMDGCVLRSDFPCFEFTINLNSLSGILRICHSQGIVSINNEISTWIGSFSDLDIDIPLKDILYDPSK